MSDPPPSHPDQTAILLTYAAEWSRARAAYEATRPALSEDAKAAGLRAARYAEASFSGPVGELIGREIRSYVNAGYVLPWRHIAPRLVSAMANRESRFPGGGTGGNNANPVTLRYIPGSNLRYIGPGPGGSVP